MKTRLLISVIALSLITCNVLATNYLSNNNSKRTNRKIRVAHHLNNHEIFKSSCINTGSTLPHLRLQLAMDAINTDDIYIGFDSLASTKNVANEDARYFQGYGRVSLASISSDNVELAINRMPLPKQTGNIHLYVNALSSGSYQLNLTENTGIPVVYDIWLMDNYKKDSLDLRSNNSYSFSMLKSDTNSFGSNRFSITIRQNKALSVKLTEFTATKQGMGAAISWKTENEANYTHFDVQRTTDGGVSFTSLNSMMSDSVGSYNYLDKKPVAATDGYRLKITDLGGTVSYSSVVTLMYAAPAAVTSSISVYPNPARGIVNFSITSSTAQGNGTSQTLNSLVGNNVPVQTATGASYGVKIINLSGTVIKTASTNSENWQTDVSTLLPGTYIIQMVKNGDGSVIGKSTFIKL